MRAVGRVGDWLLGKVAPKASAEASPPKLICGAYTCLKTNYYYCWPRQAGAPVCVCEIVGRCV